MRILVIESSPHRNGSSNLLASAFIKGAEEKGHQVTVFDAARSSIHPCLGCGKCGMDGECVQKDDMEELERLILSSQMMVLVTPLYYFGFSSQLKLTIDRWYSFTTRLSARRMKTALIVAAWDSNDWTMTDIKHHYRTLCSYMNFQNMGEILGTGCGSVSMTRASGFESKAYEFGKSIGD